MLSGAVMAVLARRMVNAGFLIGLDDVTIAYPDHLNSVCQTRESIVTPNHIGSAG